MKKSDWAPPKKKEEWHRCEECGTETFGWLSVFGDVLPPISPTEPKPDSMDSSRCLSHNKLTAPREPLCQLPRGPIQEDDPHEYEEWHIAKMHAWELQDESRRESGEGGRIYYRSVEGMGLPDT